MAIPQTIVDNRLLSFVAGTLFIQAIVIGIALAIGGSLPFASLVQRAPHSIVAHSATQIDDRVPSVDLGSEMPVPQDISSAHIPAVAMPDEKSKGQDSRPLQEEERAITVHSVQSGDTLVKIWKRYSAPVAGAVAAGRALAALDGQNPPLRFGEKIELEISAKNEIVWLRRTLKDGTLVTLEGESSTGYRARVQQPVTHLEERVVSGTILSSFASAAQRSAVPYEIVDDLVDLFSGRVEFRSLPQGVSFSFIYEERRTPEGLLLTSGPIRAASLKVLGQVLVAVRHVGSDQIERYYDETGEPVGNYFLRYPLQFTRISSAFSDARLHPIYQRLRRHNGVDFAAPHGTPVRSVADGVVAQAGYSGGAGNLIRIAHGERYSTAYLHLSRISSGLRPGAVVKRGQVIGAVGATGAATGPHLHFSLFDRGVYVNPLTASLPKMPVNGAKIPHDYLLATVKKLTAEHDAVQLASQSSPAAPKV